MLRDWRFLLLLACFALSGLAALVYQTAWTQQFALVFGASELAVASVLAAYMAGLAAGAAVAGRWVGRLQRPLLVYAVLELAIGLSALAVPAALRLAARLQVAVLGGLEVPPEAGSLASACFYLAASFVILLLPTGLMGATLPLLARHAVRRDLEIGPRIGLLYTANTMGAAGGTLLAAFVLLPRLGLGRTILVGAGVNVLVFILAAILTRGPVATNTSLQEPTTGSHPSDSSSAWQVKNWILLLILISGVVSFTWEVLWVRLLSHLLGGSIYAFGTMLATFLTGIGLGSAAAARWAVDRPRAQRGFAVAQLGIAFSSCAAFFWVDRLPALAGDLAKSGGALSASAPLAAATLLPGALFIGATFPFAVRVLATGAAEAGSASARVYAWNTVGAIVGAVGTGFVLLPALGVAGLATAAVATSLTLAVAASLLARPRRPTLAAAAVAGLAVLAIWPPPTPWQVLRYSSLTGKPATGEVVFYGVGRSATVLLTQEGADWRLTTNGLPEAAIEPRGARPGRFAIAQWLALLPHLSRPEARSILIVGLGAGTTLEAVPPSFETIHLVELEPEVVQANRSKAGERRRDPLADPRLNLHLNDARSALLLSERRFDAIVSQPSHPWTTGASHLFTREFFELVHQRLLPRGVFAQWIGLQFVDGDLLRSLVATLGTVFPYVELYQPFPGGGVLFLCGLEPLSIAESAEHVLETGAEKWQRLGVLVPEDIITARLLDAEGSRRFARGSSGATPLNTDSNNLLQTQAPRILRQPLGAEGARRLLADFDPLGQLPSDADNVYLVRRLIRDKAIHRARRLAAVLHDPTQREVALALTHIASGRPRLGEKMLSSAFELNEARLAGDSAEAAGALFLLKRQEIKQGRVPQRLAARLDTDPVSAAVVEGWRLNHLRNPRAIRRLEPALALAGPRHPLFEVATALRIAWRQATGEPNLAKEALELFEPVLAHGVQGGSGLLQRARLSMAAQMPDATLASLLELGAVLQRQTRDSPARLQLAQRALGVLSTLNPLTRDDPRVTDLEAQLSNLIQAAP
ncbi:MAG: fused MFS/spermidine synthase [Acidobacteriota bacterium]